MSSSRCIGYRSKVRCRSPRKPRWQECALKIVSTKWFLRLLSSQKKKRWMNERRSQLVARWMVFALKSLASHRHHCYQIAGLQPFLSAPPVDRHRSKWQQLNRNNEYTQSPEHFLQQVKQNIYGSGQLDINFNLFTFSRVPLLLILISVASCAQSTAACWIGELQLRVEQMVKWRCLNCTTANRHWAESEGAFRIQIVQ